MSGSCTLTLCHNKGVIIVAIKQPEEWNVHHILWQARFWNTGWAEKVRRLEYLRVQLPKDSLHSTIHNKIADVPKPNGQQCKKAYWAILDGLHDGTLSLDDPLVKRLDFLMSIWTFDKCPRTYLALRWQEDIVLAHQARDSVIY